MFENIKNYEIGQDILLNNASLSGGDKFRLLGVRKITNSTNMYLLKIINVAPKSSVINPINLEWTHSYKKKPEDFIGREVTMWFHKKSANWVLCDRNFWYNGVLSESEQFRIKRAQNQAAMFNQYMK